MLALVWVILGLIMLHLVGILVREEFVMIMMVVERFVVVMIMRKI